MFPAYADKHKTDGGNRPHAVKAIMLDRKRTFYMVNKKLLLGMLVLTLVFGMTVVGCDDGSDDGGDKEGKVSLPSTTGAFTFTGIPSKYNGKFVILGGQFKNDPKVMIGFKGATKNTSNPEYYSSITGVKIQNGSVTIPLYTYSSSSPVSTIQAYSGNDSLFVDILVFNSETFSFANFQNYVAEVYFGTLDDDNDPVTYPVLFNKGKATKTNDDATWVEE